ncbi:LysR family transcriptional regulator [Alcaligenaceae bacterium]|nr:LysR family transcriptional regulator [Alcaligenaceae bacterium]
MDLRIFEAIMSERNLTRAADRLGLTQSGVSKGLANLRLIFRDPLFIRSASGMLPTNKAVEINHSISHSISILDNILSERPRFDHRSAHIHYTLGISDYGSYVLLPELVKALSAEAPHITLQTKDINTNTAEELLLSGQVDLCLASDATFLYPIHYSELFRDHFVCLARPGHPIEASSFGVDEFLLYKHVVMPRQGGGAMGVVEQALSALGKKRQVAVSVSSLLSVPEILSSTDMLMTTTSKVAAKLQRHAALNIHPHPLNLPRLRFTQLWHERNDRSASHQWLRQQIHQCASLLH